MRNYSDQVEAAYLSSQRQGDMMRDRNLERGTHWDRRNRYREVEYNPVVERDPHGRRWERHTIDSYRPASRNYMNILDSGHRGKGPRNYKRSDERIKEIVCDLLCENRELDASGIEVEVRNSEVILTGEVRDKYDKRLAEDLAEDVTGVSNVENRMRVS